MNGDDTSDDDMSADDTPENDATGGVTATDETRRMLARRILARMGETGQPPERGALRVNVGTEDLLELLRKEYLVPIREAGRVSSFKLVQATFGGGKTHFLHCLREVAWKEGFVTALVSLSQKEAPCDDPVRVYQTVAQRLEGPPEDELEEGDPGIDVLLRLEVERRMRSQPESELRAWLRDEFGRARVDSHAVRRAAQLFMEAVLDRDDARAEVMAAYLRGEDVPPGEVRPFGVRESLETATGFKFLRSLAQVLRALDVPGLVLLFDEMDRLMSLPKRRRQDLADTVREVIDACGQASLAGVLWVYAAPPEFMTNLVPDYPALEQRLKGLARFAAVNPQSPLIDLEQLGIGQVELLGRIGQRLLEVYEEAHDAGLDPDVQKRNLERLAQWIGGSALEVGARRTFVRAALRAVHHQHLQGEHRLTDREIEGFAMSLPPAAPAGLEGDEVFG